MSHACCLPRKSKLPSFLFLSVVSICHFQGTRLMLVLSNKSDRMIVSLFFSLLRLYGEQ